MCVCVCVCVLIGGGEEAKSKREEGRACLLILPTLLLSIPALQEKEWIHQTIGLCILSN